MNEQRVAIVTVAAGTRKSDDDTPDVVILPEVERPPRSFILIIGA